jgi:ATP-binding cassette subfamily F protein uup
VALLTLRDLSLHQGTTLLLDQVNLNIDPRERIALIGRNGMGKSTLMKVINREVPFDSGDLVYQNNVHVSRLEQEVPRDTQGSIFAVIAAGLGQAGKDLGDYLEMSTRFDELSPQEHAHYQELHVDWNLQSKVEKTLSELSLNGEDDFASLSGGMKRRVLLGRALVQDPDLLLLDEPTNHLDIESILWLEKFLLNYPAAILFITHDRALLQKLATRIIELDRGQLTSFPSDYSTYLTRKNDMLEIEARHNAIFDKKLAAEEIWIRQGIKARRCRNEGRVRALEKLRAERQERRKVMGNVSLATAMAERSGQLVLEAKNLSYHLDGMPLIQDFSTTIERGDKIGILGPNGCGKSTLLKLLLGQLKPDSGTVRLGENLQIAYFDQLREALDPNQSLADNVMEGSTTIEINGEKKHIISYLQDFLFAPERARGPVKVLSGGERNRLLLAKLFAKPSNILIMDEPTNDLDIETLDLLEELLIDYKGTLIVVSHDREFLNHVVTSTIAFEGEGRVYEYIGGYDDWVTQRRTPIAQPEVRKPNKSTAETNTKAKPSQKEAHALKVIEDRITDLETALATLHQKIADPEFYTFSSDKQQTVFAEVKQLDEALKIAIAEWEKLLLTTTQ